MFKACTFRNLCVKPQYMLSNLSAVVPEVFIPLSTSMTFVTVPIMETNISYQVQVIFFIEVCPPENQFFNTHQLEIITPQIGIKIQFAH